MFKRINAWKAVWNRNTNKLETNKTYFPKVCLISIFWVLTGWISIIVMNKVFFLLILINYSIEMNPQNNCWCFSVMHVASHIPRMLYALVDAVTDLTFSYSVSLFILSLHTYTYFAGVVYFNRRQLVATFFSFICCNSRVYFWIHIPGFVCKIFHIRGSSCWMANNSGCGCDEYEN